MHLLPTQITREEGVSAVNGSVHGRRGDADLAGQLPFGPVRGALRCLLQRPHHHLLHLGVGDGARHPRAGLIAQPVQPPGQEPGPPLAHGAPVHPQPRGDGDIGAAVRAGQHDPRPQRQPLRGLPSLRPVLQRPPLGLRQHHRYQPRITHATSRPQTRRPRHHPGCGLRRNTTHVVKRELKTGTLGQQYRHSVTRARRVGYVCRLLAWSAGPVMRRGRHGPAGSRPGPFSRVIGAPCRPDHGEDHISHGTRLPSSGVTWTVAAVARFTPELTRAGLNAVWSTRPG